MTLLPSQAARLEFLIFEAFVLVLVATAWRCIAQAQRILLKP
jgi:hypothetical protein